MLLHGLLTIRLNVAIPRQDSHIFGDSPNGLEFLDFCLLPERALTLFLLLRDILNWGLNVEDSSDTLDSPFPKCEAWEALCGNLRR